MISRKLVRARDTVYATGFLATVHLRFLLRGQAAAARWTAQAMRVEPATQAELDARGIDAWQTGRAVWRAKRWLPPRSTCLQTALATQMLFKTKGVAARVCVGVKQVEQPAHAWAEIGDFVLDDQRISQDFVAFDAPLAAGKAQR
jgi:hypothetical protein